MHDQQAGDQPNLPTQHTIHTRVQTNLQWIASTVFEGATCGIGADIILEDWEDIL